MCVQENTSLEDTLALMDKHGIQSMPVLKQDDQKMVVGIINTMDILTRVVFDKILQSDDVKSEDLTQHQATQNKMLKELTVADAAGTSLESKTTWSYKYADDLDKLLNVMSSGVHRVLVTKAEFDTEDADPLKHLGFISQRDVLRHLMSTKHKRTVKVLAQPVSSVAKEGVLFVKDSATALTAFRRMVLENELSAMPIVNESSKLVDTISASDIRKVRGDHVPDLLLPVGEFMEKAKTRSPGSSYQIKCSASTTVGQALTMLLASKVHRAWVCDEEGKPVGAISFTDILKAIFLAED